ncbi:MAG: ATP-binding protein [Methylocella sp.]
MINGESRLQRQQEVLAEFGELALRSDNLDEILTEACRLVGEALDTDLAKVMEMQEDGVTLLVRAGVGWKSYVVGKITVTAVRGSSEGYALQTGLPVMSDDIDQETRFKYADFIKDNGVKAIVSVIILGADGKSPYGILQVDSRTPRNFNEQDTKFLRGYANLLAAAVDRLRVAGEMRDAQAALRESEAALRELNETLEKQVTERTRERDQIWRVSPDLFVLCGLDGCCRSVNPAWTESLGYPREDLIGARFEHLVHPEQLTALRGAFERLVQGTVVHDLDVQMRARDGSYNWRSWTCIPEDGEFYAAGRDIDDRKQLEEQLRQSQKMEAVGQLTGGLAHDFNNLLTGITGSLELLGTRVRQGRLKDVDRYIGAAQGAATRAAALTHRLLVFSRQQTLAPIATDVNRLVAGMEEMVRRTVGPAIEIEVVGAAELWTALVDPNQLENALLNLCINARDAMPDGGRITIATANNRLDERKARARDLPPGDYLSLCVIDTGTGMPPEVIARAFDPFYTTKPLGQGTGLGLSMIYGFARQSGGQIRIQSEVGAGTTICLYLPRHDGEEAKVQSPAGLDDVVSRAEHGEAVLVVDDEPTVRMLVAEVLEDLGYIAIEAADGAAGLRILQSDVRIDLLVTDVGLPGALNGRQVADAARQVRPELKVLFITGYADSAVFSRENLKPGMSILIKPFPMEVLASRIKEMINA